LRPKEIDTVRKREAERMRKTEESAVTTSDFTSVRLELQQQRQTRNKDFKSNMNQT
jgi:hypothetical protein